MSNVAVEVDQELVEILREMDRPVGQAAQELIVLELYRQRHISSGKAAELLGMRRYDFIRHASDLGIPFFAMTEEEWETERRAANRLAHGSR
jgi:predicted HTH domain antitoxin